MGEGRLEGLLMEIHKRIHVDAAAVVKMYIPQEERHLHLLEVKQREVGYRACWLDAQTGPAWRNRPPASRARGRRYTYRDLAHRVLYTARASRRRGSDQPAKGPDAAAGRIGLGEGGEDVVRLGEGPRTCDACQ